jgi:hypothetical protein
MPQPSNGGYGGFNGYSPGFTAGTAGAPLPATQPNVTPGITEALASIPPEQKVLVLFLTLEIGSIQLII